MGIPSYFSYIVKNHPEILQKYASAASAAQMHNLYMDCNSIIYDAFYSMTDEEKKGDIDAQLVQKVIVKINEYIVIVNPSDTIIIAFDGVAPVAKLDQQRTRRYKSWFQANITNALHDKEDSKWSTAAITPGTQFMKQLNEGVTEHFANLIINPKIIVSATDDAGEGEHKIFQYIRDNAEAHADKNTVVYGLDADLIMLSITHLPICSQIYLFRETPEFIKSISADLEPDQNYLLDIPRLAKNVISEMQPNTQQQDGRLVYDYIFLCFFLGNDFLPHFPALNIRTGGIDKLLDHYRHTLGKANKYIITPPVNGAPGKINWKNLRAMITSVSGCEKDYIRAELALRAKREKRYAHIDTTTPEQKMDKFQSIPCYERAKEKNINPDDPLWRHKYYTTLFQTEPDEERIRQICRNYLEGLEWTFGYYTDTCPDWTWSYKYQYPPLLQDLLLHIPYFDTQFIQSEASSTSKPVSPYVQLCYVLPPRSLSLLPHKIYKRLLTTCPEYYPDTCEFTWAFCRYFWEAHTSLPEIDISVLNQVVAATA